MGCFVWGRHGARLHLCIQILLRFQVLVCSLRADKCLSIRRGHQTGGGGGRSGSAACIFKACLWDLVRGPPKTIWPSKWPSLPMFPFRAAKMAKELQIPFALHSVVDLVVSWRKCMIQGPQRPSRGCVTSPPSHPLLPPGGEQRKTPDGRVFYVNRTTRKTQWEEPPIIFLRVVFSAPSPSPPPQGKPRWANGRTATWA